MGLPWVRLDSQFPSHPKVLMLVQDKKYRAAFVFTCSLSYSGGHGTDGLIPRTALPFIHGTTRDAADLVAVKLWHVDRKGWFINDWADYQPTSLVTAETLAKKRVGALKGNCHRWHEDGCECWRNAG